MHGRDSRSGRSSWSDHLGDELAFWRHSLMELPEDLLERLDRARRFRDDEAVQHLSRYGRLRVLDVGSGPVSTLGYTHPGCRIDLVAVDPLALDYHELLLARGLEAPVVPIHVEAERLHEVFPRDSFDCAYACNSLDHCYDPPTAIESMFRVVRVGGGVSLLHVENVGASEGYEGLHQWNFHVEEGRPLLANRDRSTVVDLRERFAPIADLIQVERDEVPHGDQGPRATLLLRYLKTADRA